MQRRSFVNGLRQICSLVAALLMMVPGSIASGQDEVTPADVYLLLQHAADHVQELRELAGVDTPWPVIETEGERSPRHVLQKSFEVLEKINRLRQIRGMGAITIPRYPSRLITPDEVYIAAQRLQGELELILGKGTHSHDDSRFVQDNPVAVEDNYTLLSRISLAIDPILGVRGFTPGDVYAQSARVLENAKFLRASQNLPMDIEPPQRTAGNYPNHALQAAVALLDDIAQAEQRLWIAPCTVPQVPKRKIDPNEVYDLLQVVLAEQQRIKHRLGVDRQFTTPPVEPARTPDDVVFNLQWARLLLPRFEMKRPLVQYGQNSLLQRPVDVYAIAMSISDRLVMYREERGIRVQPRLAIRAPERQPKHVYQRTLECLEKVNRLREQKGLDRTFVPEFPLREITPVEVFDLAVRLDAELAMIAPETVSPAYLRDISQLSGREITLTDVHEIMSRNSHALDTILGSQGYTPNDVYQQAERIVDEFSVIRRCLGITAPVEVPSLSPGKEPRDVIALTHSVLKLLIEAQRRSGMSQPAVLPERATGQVTPNDVYNDVGMILAEIVSLKVHLNLHQTTVSNALRDDRTSSHVYQKMEYAHRLIISVLEDDPVGKNSVMTITQERP